MHGLDYPARLAAERAQRKLAERLRARRDGLAESLEPPFPYRAIPFDPADFGAVPSASRVSEEDRPI
jgi:hypothetical protein